MKNTARAFLGFAAMMLGASVHARPPVPEDNRPSAPVTYDASRKASLPAARRKKQKRPRPDHFATPALRAKLARRALAARHREDCANTSRALRHLGLVTHGRFDR